MNARDPESGQFVQSMNDAIREAAGFGESTADAAIAETEPDLEAPASVETGGGFDGGQATVTGPGQSDAPADFNQEIRDRLNWQRTGESSW